MLISHFPEFDAEGSEITDRPPALHAVPGKKSFAFICVICPLDIVNENKQSISKKFLIFYEFIINKTKNFKIKLCKHYFQYLTQILQLIHLFQKKLTNIVGNINLFLIF